MAAEHSHTPDALDAPCGWSIRDAIELLTEHGRALERAQAEAYAAGRTDGIEAAREQAARDLDEPWQQLSRRVRADADRLDRPVPTPTTRPQPDDSIWFRPDEWARITGTSNLGRAA